jgi:NADPH2:quinone reductase
MKTIRVSQFGDPDVLRLEEAPDPQPGPGQVVLRVHAVGVNPVDTYVRSGRYAARPSLPYTPGSDAAGVIETVGEGVEDLAPGDRVYTDHRARGAYAERMVCDAAWVHRLPEGVGFAQGAALGVPYGTAYRALFVRGAARPGETVLVHGATGGVGVAAVQLARAAGLTVIGTGGTEPGRDMVREQGAHHVLDHHEESYLEAARALTPGGRGIDLIVEMLANVNLGRDLGALAPRGRVVVVGSRGRVEIDPRDTMGRDADIRGLILGNASPEEVRSIHAALGAGLENGALRPIIAREMPLADAPRAHEAVMEPGAQGKIVLIP